MGNTYDQDILIQNRDENGNLYKSFPVTKWHNILEIPPIGIIDTPEGDDPVQFETNDVVVEEE